MSDADRFAAQDTAHDLCDYNCGQIMQGVECPAKEMNSEIWNEMMELIAKYDWAVEGFMPPVGMKVSKENAVTIRNALVNLTKEIV